MLFWRIAFEINKSLYLYLPRWLGGEENINQIDLCSRALNINSALFLSEAGWTICDEHLQNKLTGRTTASIVLVVVLFWWFLLWLFWCRKPIPLSLSVPPQPSFVKNIFIYNGMPLKGTPIRKLLVKYSHKLTTKSTFLNHKLKLLKLIKTVK